MCVFSCLVGCVFRRVLFLSVKFCCHSLHSTPFFCCCSVVSLRGLGLFCCVGFGVCWEACFVVKDLKFVATFGQMREMGWRGRKKEEMGCRCY